MKYNGNDVFKPFNAGLYGIDDGDTDRSMLWDESRASILQAFKYDYEQKIRTALHMAGLKYIGLTYYSPKFYNFETDSIDLECEIVDRGMLWAALEKHKPAILKAMAENKSHDGYMALTADTWADVYDGGYDKLDILAVTAILSGIDFSDFDLYEYLEYDFACDKCTWIHSEYDNYDDDTRKIVDACPLYQDEKKSI